MASNKENNASTSPLVSVVIPCYNMGEFVMETVDSVLKQTYQNIEIIVVNDGSTDKGTVNVLSKINDPKIQVIHTENQGLPAARNNGIKIAKGEYVLPLDADDMIESTYIEKAVRVLEKNPKVGFVTPWIKAFGIVEWMAERPKFDLVQSLAENMTCVASLIRKTCLDEIGGYDEKMRGGYEDWDLWIRIGAKGWEGEVVPEPLFLYRQRPDSMVRTSNKADNRAKLIRQLISNNRELYEKFFEEVLIAKDALYMQRSFDCDSLQEVIREKERMIQEKEHELHAMRSSLRWKVSNYFYKRFAKLRNIFS